MMKNKKKDESFRKKYIKPENDLEKNNIKGKR